MAAHYPAKLRHSISFIREKHFCDHERSVRTVLPVNAIFLRCVAALALVLLSPSAFAQGLGLFSPGDGRAIDIEADNGIEWRQNENVYIARQNARATRGRATLYGDTLTAHYRPVPRAQRKPADTDSLSGSTEIYRI